MNWNYSIPHNRSVIVQLLTTGGFAVHGKWQGDYGQYFIAWYPLPVRDMQLERELRTKLNHF